MGILSLEREKDGKEKQGREERDVNAKFEDDLSVSVLSLRLLMGSQC